MHKLLAGKLKVLVFMSIFTINVYLCGIAFAEDAVDQQAAVPIQFPALYYGTVESENGEVINAGIIRAYVGGELCGQLPFSEGQYGMPPEDPNVKRLLVYSTLKDLTDKQVDFKVFIDNQEYQALTDPEKVIWASEEKTQVNLVVPSFSGSTVPFADLQGHWSVGVVRQLVNMGIISGYEDNSFRPDNLITRTECAALIARALSIPPGDVEKLNIFSDRANIMEWAKSIVASVVDAGYINGYMDADGNKTFEPDKPVTRVELATILSRYFIKESSDEPKVTDNNFADQDKIPGWAINGINVAVFYGLVNGYPDGTFKPQQAVTRAEAASMISNLIGKI